MTAATFGRRIPARQGAVQAPAPSAAARAKMPALLLITLLALMVPAYFSIGPLKMSPSKVLFLVTVPMLTINLVRGRYGRMNIVDALVFAYIFWMGLALLFNHSVGRVVEYMGSVSLILLGGYLTGRATVRSREAMIALIGFLAAVVVISLPFAIYESWTSRTTIPRWLAMLPGIRSHSDVQHPLRLGLYRTQFVFAHPIHYGLFCALTFSLVFVGLAETWGRMRRYLVSAIVVVCCVFSVSSGPLLAMATEIALIGWAVTMNWTGRRWAILGWIVGIGYAIAELASTRVAIYAIVERLAISPETAFFRRLQFEFGLRQIERTPILGVGFHDFPLPFWFNTTSIDNFWLLLALQFGVPTFLFCACAFLAAMILVGRNDLGGRPDLLSLRLGWMFAMIAVVLALATVALWGEMYSIVLLVLGAGLWLSTVDGTVPRTGPATAEDGTADLPRQRYTRFAGGVRPAAPRPPPSYSRGKTSPRQEK